MVSLLRHTASTCQNAALQKQLKPSCNPPLCKGNACFDASGCAETAENCAALLGPESLSGDSAPALRSFVITLQQSRGQMWAAKQILPWLSYSALGLLKLGSCTPGTVKRQTGSKDSVATF